MERGMEEWKDRGKDGWMEGWRDGGMDRGMKGWRKGRAEGWKDR